MDHLLNRLIGIPELFEAVLLQLPVRDLLIVQRVSRTFKAVIDASPMIQEALFFRARPASSDGRVIDFNPLLGEAFPCWFALHVKTARRAQEVSHLKEVEQDMPSDLIKARRRKEASWRRMFPAQPPPQTFEIIQISHGRGGNSYTFAKIPYDKPCQGGVRMGALYDMAEEHVSRHRVSSFWVDWYDQMQPRQPWISKKLQWEVVDAALLSAKPNTVTLTQYHVQQCRREIDQGQSIPPFRVLDMNELTLKITLSQKKLIVMTNSGALRSQNWNSISFIAVALGLT
jgi:hypothetical protein